MAAFEEESAAEDSRSDESTALKISKIERTARKLGKQYDECKKSIIENVTQCKYLEETRRDMILGMEGSSRRIDELKRSLEMWTVALRRVAITYRTVLSAERRAVCRALILVLDDTRQCTEALIQQAIWTRSLYGNYWLTSEIEKAELETDHSRLLEKLGLVVNCLRNAIAERDRLLRVGRRMRNTN